MTSTLTTTTTMTVFMSIALPFRFVPSLRAFYWKIHVSSCHCWCCRRIHWMQLPLHRGTNPSKLLVSVASAASIRSDRCHWIHSMWMCHGRHRSWCCTMICHCPSTVSIVPDSSGMDCSLSIVVAVVVLWLVRCFDVWMHLWMCRRMPSNRPKLFRCCNRTTNRWIAVDWPFGMSRTAMRLVKPTTMAMHSSTIQPVAKIKSNCVLSTQDVRVFGQRIFGFFVFWVEKNKVCVCGCVRERVCEKLDVTLCAGRSMQISVGIVLCEKCQLTLKRWMLINVQWGSEAMMCYSIRMDSVMFVRVWLLYVHANEQWAMIIGWWMCREWVCAIANTVTYVEWAWLKWCIEWCRSE